jgi:hypothetical protein
MNPLINFLVDHAAQIEGSVSTFLAEAFFESAEFLAIIETKGCPVSRGQRRTATRKRKALQLQICLFSKGLSRNR